MPLPLLPRPGLEGQPLNMNIHASGGKRLRGCATWCFRFPPAPTDSPSSICPGTQFALVCPKRISPHKPSLRRKAASLPGCCAAALKPSGDMPPRDRYSTHTKIGRDSNDLTWAKKVSPVLRDAETARPLKRVSPMEMVFV